MKGLDVLRQSSQALKGFYNRVSGEGYKSMCEKSGWDGRKIISPYVEQYRKRNILEIGCADGYVIKLFADVGSSTTGMDYSENMIVAARNTTPETKLVVADINERWPFENGTFDFIFALSVLEYSVDLGNVFREISRVLKRAADSKFVFTVEQIAPEYNQTAAEYEVPFGDQTFIFKRFDLESLRFLIQPFGLAIQHLKTFRAFKGQNIDHIFYYGLYEAVFEMLK